MKKLKTTLFVIGILILITQTIRHSYVRIYYNKPSALDKYEKNEIDLEIKNTTSFDSLLLEFDKAHKAVVAFEKNKTKEELNKMNRYGDEPYLTKSKYKKAITDWEDKSKKTHELIVFWIVSFILIIIGIGLHYLKHSWISMALIISGFLEMIWWSSPSFATVGAHVEFLRLLNTKLILSTISLTLLIIMWIIDKRKNNF